MGQAHQFVKSATTHITPVKMGKRNNMNISVTQIDVDSGVRSSVTNCPIARAIRRYMEKIGFSAHSVRLYVAQSRIEIEARYKGQWVMIFEIRTPKKGEDFISDFDQYGVEGVRPVRLNIPGLERLRNKKDA